MLSGSFSEVLEVRLPGATGDDTDTDLEFEILDGAGEHRHTLGSLQPLFSWTTELHGARESQDLSPGMVETRTLSLALASMLVSFHSPAVLFLRLSSYFSCRGQEGDLLHGSAHVFR